MIDTHTDAATLLRLAKVHAEILNPIDSGPAPKPANMHIRWALAVAMNRLPATSEDLARLVCPNIRF